jgi:hypothetical protein
VFDQTFPPLLAAALPLAHDDFASFDEFESAEDTQQWWRAWTDNEGAGVPPFRVFGESGSGNRAALWIRDPEAAIETQPVVVLGSEGQTEVIARNLGDYLWLLANGIRPTAWDGSSEQPPQPVPGLLALAPGEPRTTEAVITGGRELRPELEEFVEEVCWGPFDDDGEPIE